MIINQNHPTFTTCNDVADLSKPLKQLGIIYFDYTRHEHSGGRIWLTSHRDSTATYLAKKYYLSGNMEGSPTQYKPAVVLCDTLPKQHIYDDVLRSYNIDHAMQIIKPHQNYCEYFGFATVKGNSKIINTYLTKLDVLKNFCNYFIEQASPLITIADKNKVILPFHHNTLDFIDHDCSELDFEKKFRNKKSMTKRQVECATLLLAGQDNRQIATALNLSPRTVEHYFNNLKIKLKCKNKTALIIKLIEIL